MSACRCSGTGSGVSAASAARAGLAVALVAPYAWVAVQDAVSHHSLRGVPGALVGAVVSSTLGWLSLLFSSPARALLIAVVVSVLTRLALPRRRCKRCRRI